jgi:hypothetical protein
MTDLAVIMVIFSGLAVFIAIFIPIFIIIMASTSPWIRIVRLNRVFFIMHPSLVQMQVGRINVFVGCVWKSSK